MKKQDYTKLSEKELKEKLEDIRLIVMNTYTFTEQKKGFKESRRKLRKEMVRIKTELTRRKNE